MKWPGNRAGPLALGKTLERVAMLVLQAAFGVATSGT